jgi:hypothetical protein
MYLPMTRKIKENGGESQENQRKPSEIISCLGNDFQRLVGIGGNRQLQEFISEQR